MCCIAAPLIARAEFLPLKDDNWITCGNALRLDWLKVCPPEGTGVKLHTDDLFQTPLEQPEIDFENEGRRNVYLWESAVSRLYLPIAATEV